MLGPSTPFPFMLLDDSLRSENSSSVSRHMCVPVHKVDVPQYLSGIWGQFAGVSTLFPLSGSQGWSSGGQAWWQTPLPAEPSCRFSHLLGNCHLSVRQWSLSFWDSQYWLYWSLCTSVCNLFTLYYKFIWKTLWWLIRVVYSLRKSFHKVLSSYSKCVNKKDC